MPEPSGDKRRLLIVDDERIVARALGRLLGVEYAVTLAYSAGEALERLGAGERYDAILSDVTMPDIDGIAFFSRVAAIDEPQSRRFIFLTGGGHLTPQLQLFLDRLESPPPVLGKPFQPSRLKELIANQTAALPAPAL